MNLFEIQSKVRKYVEERVTTRPFGLNSLPEEEFKKAMDVITEEISVAWVAGYMEKSNEKESKRA